MTRSEIIDFLSLAQDITNEELLKAIQEKEGYFKSLINNAPTNLLKKVYERNIEKLSECRDFLKNTSSNNSINNLKPDISIKNDIPKSYLDSTTAPTFNRDPAWLIRHTENSATISFILKEGINTIGRLTKDSNLNIAIEDDMFVSRKHAIIEIKESDYILYDVGDSGLPASKNGVFVNGSDKKLMGKYSLREGDTIQFGKTKFVFKINTHRNLEEVVNEVSNTNYMRTVVINIL
ncbi:MULTISPECIES: FHA domain-containing protein [Flectobacillus]|uniref:FHA domain-containing protein n=1 Tax=Flectobacillus TaxID=101 RepID=UPI000BA46C94|nr:MULTISPECIES: FHA domain-containing protein [Flectobacillus]MDI9872300.1 FHA domain-containing protein [Flectobacillus roseus]PAC28868.1 hypothetical protein BWI92_17705 [Flectobacillus sp. BAB-3569]